MDHITALVWSYANILTKKRYDALNEHYGSLEQALAALDEAMLKSLGCKQDTIFGVLNRLEEFNAAEYSAQLEKRGIEFLTIEDDAYPTLLKTIPDAPVFLYYKGSLEIFEQPCIGLVGAREMNDYGKRVTEAFVPPLVEAGITTVSGLAFGIDAQVAIETLHAKGKTAAVLGHGLGMISPKSNEKLASRIVDEGGLLLTEYPLDQNPEKMTFPARNRIVAGLSTATVVLQAGKASGSMITADLALEYGREVFAVPGQVFDDGYRGSHELIASGRAKLAQSPQVVLSDIGIVASERQKEELVLEDEQEQLIYGVLTSMPQSASDIVEKAQLDAAIITAKLTMLELQGAARNVGNGMWVKA